MVVWWATKTECVSALVRQTRDGSLRIEDERQARQVLGQLAEAWIEVQASEVLRGTAERLLAVHALRAADAFQLAAALHWCQRQTTNMEISSSTPAYERLVTGRGSASCRRRFTEHVYSISSYHAGKLRSLAARCN